MMTDFSLQLAKFAEKAGANADLVVRKVAIEVLSSVVQKSPVKTGRFINNWISSIGAPDNSSTTKTDPSGELSIAAGVSTFSRFSAGQVAYISNNLPYAQKLEDGGSKTQAPNGMVRITVAQFRDFLDNAVAGIKK